MGNGFSGFTAPITSPDETTTSWPPGARSSTFTIPESMTLDSISEDFKASKHSSPTSLLLMTHWIIPVESRSTINQILLEPRVR